ncbi:YeeE/YedE family protein [Ferrimonas marina]|uniref:Sulphur transport domain-containing protein n=1 Tax=Ferrimonas marina TaxID=299255 RepID=A0A1M5X3Z0_9GAMM|nr:YeeE/YedE family protein [Ferrimonas marina]SHH94258.1 hypothetical protein SAMN02745129_3187 [Ferrimonas marina]
MNKLIAFGCGLLFGFGLFVSGMADPAKVLGFLDLSRLADGSWDPALMAVMGGALAVFLPGYLLWVKPRAEQGAKPAAGDAYHLPLSQAIDGRLLGGAALFGLGWGVAGLCPGPALASLGTGHLTILAFVLSMAAGIRLACAWRPKAAVSLPGQR